MTKYASLFLLRVLNFVWCGAKSENKSAAVSSSCSYVTASLTIHNCLTCGQPKAGLEERAKQRPLTLLGAPLRGTLWGWLRLQLHPQLELASPSAQSHLISFQALSPESSHQETIIFHLKMSPGSCPFIPVIALREDCIVVPLELLLLSFLHPVLFPFSFPMSCQ